MPATAEIIEDLQRSNTKESYDEKLFTNSSIKDFDQLVLHNHYGGQPSEERLIADKVIKIDPFSNNISPTLSGVLFFHRAPNKIIEGAEILFTKFSGKDMSKILRTKDYSSPLVSMINEVLEDLEKELGTSTIRKGVLIKEGDLEVPKIVMREGLVNAIIHRKYFIPDSIKVALFDDRLEIYSPGNFPGPITDYLSGTSYSRNPTLRQIARNIGLVEKRGLGLPLIFSECKRNNNPTPQIIEQSGDFVKLIVYFPNSKIHQIETDKTQGILDHFKNHKSFTLSEVAQMLNCSKNTASTRLTPYLDSQIIYKVGKGRATHYVWKKEKL